MYDQLRHVASRSLRSKRSDHALRATALVHEASIRPADANGEWQDRVHFYAVASILVDHMVWIPIWWNLQPSFAIRDGESQSRLLASPRWFP